MNSMSKRRGTSAVFTVLVTMMFGFCLVPRVSAHSQRDLKKVQETLHDKGFYQGPVDGIVGHQTREAIRQYQRSEDLPVTGKLDDKTAERIGIGPESVGGDFKNAGKEVGRGGQGVGHEMKQGKPIAAGKDLGLGLGRGGKDVGKGVAKAVDPDSDSADPAKK